MSTCRHIGLSSNTNICFSSIVDSSHKVLLDRKHNNLKRVGAQVSAVSDSLFGSSSLHISTKLNGSSFNFDH